MTVKKKILSLITTTRKEWKKGKDTHTHTPTHTHTDTDTHTHTHTHTQRRSISLSRSHLLSTNVSIPILSLSIDWYREECSFSLFLHPTPRGKSPNLKKKRVSSRVSSLLSSSIPSQGERNHFFCCRSDTETSMRRKIWLILNRMSIYLSIYISI